MGVLSEQELARRAAELEWVLADVDGVLTDGGLYYDRRGHAMLRFDVRDGQGLKLAQQGGLKVGILSGRSPAALEHRADELGLDALLTGIHDKGVAFEAFLGRQGTAPRRVAFIGDDLPDLVVLGRCGLAFAPADAAPEVRTIVHQVTAASGGRGAVREMVETILRARGVWDQVFRAYTFDR
jgi:3-deoxy-D-manno-octulosonate 8-phosphate phosphatase (KDO 8-P phosphatase)